MMKTGSNKTKWRDLALIAGSMANLYQEGIVFNCIFELLADLPIGECYKKALIEIKEYVNKGESLQEAFAYRKDIFTNFYIAMIGVGEKTGRISEALEGLELFYNKVWFVKKTILDAVTYPLILIIAMNCVFIFLVAVVIPNFSDIFLSMNKEMPKAFEIIMALNNFVKEKPFVFGTLFICWFIAIPFIIIKYFLKDKIVKKLNNLHIYKEISEYILIILLEVIIKSGINLAEGLNYCYSINISRFINQGLKEINDGIMSGDTLYDSMSKINTFSKYTLAHIKMGEEGGGLEHILVKLEKDLFLQIEGNIKKKSSLLQPILIGTMGAVIVIFMIIFIMPIFNTLLSGA